MTTENTYAAAAGRGANARFVPGGVKHRAAPELEIGAGWVVLRDCPLGGGGPRVDLVLIHPRLGVALVDLAPKAADDDAAERLRRGLEARRFPAIFGGHPPIVRAILPPGQPRDLSRVLAAGFDTQPPLALAGGDAWVATARAAAEANLPVAIPESAGGQRNSADAQRGRATQAGWSKPGTARGENEPTTAGSGAAGTPANDGRARAGDTLAALSPTLGALRRRSGFGTAVGEPPGPWRSAWFWGGVAGAAFCGTAAALLVLGPLTATGPTPGSAGAPARVPDTRAEVANESTHGAPVNAAPDRVAAAIPAPGRDKGPIPQSGPSRDLAPSATAVPAGEATDEPRRPAEPRKQPPATTSNDIVVAVPPRVPEERRPEAGAGDAARPPRPAASRAAVDEPEMVALPGGTFRMGSNEDASERPIHAVTVAPFLMAAHAVTLGEWRPCAEAGACRPAPDGAPDQPMTNVSWDDARAFAAWLSASTDKRYRLPTEAEWEYAARAGTETRFWWGDAFVRGKASCKDCGSEPVGVAAPPRVGAYPPNPFGLYGMGGGVAEWVADCWHRDHQGAPRDGATARDAVDCRQRVLRGGTWRDDASYLRPSNRGFYDAPVRYPTHGFRVARAE
jgi:formylglycine-generating enzyme required for sulfatase activity